MRWLRRLVLLALIGAIAAALLARQRHHEHPPSAPSWPPLDPAPERSRESSVGAAAPATWVAPVDGQCPDGYPVKANDNSGIYHVPGGRFYDRTVPERCYAAAVDAERDGYRATKA